MAIDPKALAQAQYQAIQGQQGQQGMLGNYLGGVGISASTTTNPWAVSYHGYQYYYTYGNSPSIAPVPLDEKKIAELAKVEPRKVGQRVPDGVEVMTGWRCWYVGHVAEGIRLRALGQSTVWEPKKQLVAACSNGLPHIAPHKQCQCGIWSFHTLEKLIPAAKGYTGVTVLGKVSIWGRIVECENGFRSQFAYPAELWLLDESVEELGYIYGVPVRTL